MARPFGCLRLAALFLLAAGCADQIVYVPIVAPPHQPAARTAAQVELFVLTPSPRPHVDVGMLQVIRGANGETVTQMLSIMRAQAAMRGCDAIVVTMIDARATKNVPASVEGSCEIYTDPRPAPNS